MEQRSTVMVVRSTLFTQRFIVLVPWFLSIGAVTSNVHYASWFAVLEYGSLLIISVCASVASVAHTPFFLSDLNTFLHRKHTHTHTSTKNARARVLPFREVGGKGKTQQQYGSRHVNPCLLLSHFSSCLSSFVCVCVFACVPSPSPASHNRVFDSFSHFTDCSPLRLFSSSFNSDSLVDHCRGQDVCCRISFTATGTDVCGTRIYARLTFEISSSIQAVH